MQPVATQTLSDALSTLDDNADGVAMYFTSHLLSLNPALVERWPIGLAEQRRSWYFALRELVVRVERGEDVTPSLVAWGQGLVRLSLTPDDLTAMVVSVEATLRRFLGDAFVTAYSGGLGAVHQLMIGPLTAVLTAAASGRPSRIEAEVVGHDRRRPDLAVLTLRPAAPVDYSPGQSLPVASQARPRAWRPFTPAHATRDDGTIELHVRAIAGGYLSPALVYETAPGDVLAIAEPVGSLGWRDPVRDAVLIASGTGIAPFCAMLEARSRARGRKTRNRVTLVNCARSEADLYVPEPVRRLQSSYDWLTVETRTGPHSPLWRGTGEVGGPASWVSPDWTDRDLFVCGSPGFVDTATGALLAAGHDPSAVHVEQFGSTSPAPWGATAHGGGTA